MVSSVVEKPRGRLNFIKASFKHPAFPKLLIAAVIENTSSVETIDFVDVADTCNWAFSTTETMIESC